jgi:hypothetical protein
MAEGIHSVIYGNGTSVGDGKVHTEFTIDCMHPLVSVISMIAPSPDWIVGVHDLLLCRQGDWVKEYHADLFAYDCGTDSGESYTSPNAPENPHQIIKELRNKTTVNKNSAFYDPSGGSISPFAVLRLELLNVTGVCSTTEQPVSPPTPVCPDKKVFKECGTACPPTCTDPGPLICTLQCVQGCFCPGGLFLDANDECVPQDQCPDVPPIQHNCCPEGEIFKALYKRPSISMYFQEFVFYQVNRLIHLGIITLST